MTIPFAVCAIARNEASYVQEWVAFHILQGAGRILVFDNGSEDDTAELLRTAQAGGCISVVGRQMAGEHFDRMQRAAYEEGARMLAGVAAFVAFIDLDEFVFTDRSAMLSQALSAMPAEVGAIAVGQRVFGSSGHLKGTPGPVTARFAWRTAADDPESHWFKTIARPELVERFDSVHSAVLRSGHYVMADGGELRREGAHPGHAARVAAGPIRLNHYMLKSAAEYRSKRDKWSTTLLAGRYDDAYFMDRDLRANQVGDRALVRWRNRIDQEVDRLWPGRGRLRAGAGAYRFGLRHRLRRLLSRSAG